MKEFRETRNLKRFYRNWLHKACFAHDAAYFDCKDLPQRTISDKILKDRSYEIARNRKYDGYQSALASMPYKFFDKKTGSKVNVNEQLVEDLLKQVTKKMQKQKSLCEI